MATSKSNAKPFSWKKHRVILLEHLPDVKYQTSIQGVLMLLFSSGDVMFYPLNEQTKGNSPNQARMLSGDTAKKFNRRNCLNFSTFTKRTQNRVQYYQWKQQNILLMIRC